MPGRSHGARVCKRLSPRLGQFVCGDHRPGADREHPGQPGAEDLLIAILDIDGTLVDTNYQHALAWYRAFRKHGIVLGVWRIHRHIGMGGDQLVEALTNERTESELGDEIRAAEKERYLELIEEVEPMEGSRG